MAMKMTRTMTRTMAMTEVMTMMTMLIGQYAAAAAEAAGSARLAAAPASLGQGRLSRRCLSVSRSLLRTWELLAVEVSRHLGNLVAVEEDEVMVTELDGEVEVDLEERKTPMC